MALHPVLPNDPVQELDWVVPDLVARGTVTMIAGEAGAGKSRLCLREAIDVANRRGKALVIDAENGRDLVRSRVTDMGGRLGKNLEVLVSEGLDLERDLDEFIAAVRRSRPDLVILDSWVSMWDGPEGSVRRSKRCMEVIRRMAQEGNCAIIVIHHTTKGGSTYRGSSAIAATIEAVFTLTRIDETRRLLHCTKMRLAPEPPDRELTTDGLDVGGDREAVSALRADPDRWCAFRIDGGGVVARGTAGEVAEAVVRKRLRGKVRYGTERELVR